VSMPPVGLVPTVAGLRHGWGYYALPILCGDRLVGRLDARADRDARSCR
jgi:uncharacterized protein YcaQ